MNSIRSWGCLGALTFLLVAGWARAQNLARFGFGSMASEATGQRPVLLLQVEFTSTSMRTVGMLNLPTVVRAPLRLSSEELSSFVFDFVNARPRADLFRGRTVNQAFGEMSGGKFLWSRGEVLPPLKLTVKETEQIEETTEVVMLSGVNTTLQGFDTYTARESLVRRILRDNPFFDPGRFDNNADGRIDATELVVLMVTNWTVFPATGANQEQGGGNRPLVLERVPSSQAGGIINLNTRICAVDQHASLATWVHEMSHHLNAIDLYVGRQVGSPDNNHHVRSSLMGPTMSAQTDEPSMWHLDAWHKLALGWEMPRLLAAETGGGFLLRPAQRRAGGEPLLLYSIGRDPSKPDPEFFLLEYRDPTPPSGSGYDGEVVGTGLYVWHVVRDVNGNIFRLPDPVAPNDPNPNGPQSIYIEGRGPADSQFRLGGDNNDASTQFWAPNGDSTERVLPTLRWRDGTALPGQLIIRRGIAPGTLVVDWVVRSDFWVDANRVGSTGANGSAEAPWPTLAAASLAAKWGATIHCRAAVSKETGTFNRRMTLRAERGVVTFGRQ